MSLNQDGIEVNPLDYDYRDEDPDAGTNGVTNISWAAQMHNTLFLLLISTFQYAQGLFGLSQKGKKQYCCLFYPLFRYQHSLFNELSGMLRDEPYLCELCPTTSDFFPKSSLRL